MNYYREYSYPQIRLVLPKSVETLLNTLHENGYEAFVVGGCVRDKLLQVYYPHIAKEPHDWDITTSATPDEVIALFKNTINNAKQYGTISIIADDGEIYEVTTYREDVGYSNHRQPDEIKFATSLVTDCKRRDFTINSLAYSHETGLVDICNGLDDIFAGTIRCVGNADERFEEDALRILRAIRFSSTFDFNISGSTNVAISNNLDLLDYVSAERKFMELYKLSETPFMAEKLNAYKKVLFKVIPELEPCDGFNQHNPHHDKDVLTHIFETVRNARLHKASPEVTIAALLHDIGKPNTFVMDEVGHFRMHAVESEKMTREILSRFNCSNDMKDEICFLVRNHDVDLPQDEKQARRFLGKYTKKQIDDLCLLHLCDTFAHSVMNVRIYGPAFQQAIRMLEETEAKMKKENAALKLKDLNVDGHYILSLGLRGPEVGKVLNQLLDEVIDGSLENERIALCARAGVIAHNM